MRKFLLMVATLACLSTSARAATASQTGAFTDPVQYTDGSSIPAGAILSHDIDCQFTAPGASVSTPCVFSPTSSTGTSLSVTVTYPADTGGKACFRVTARTAGSVSALSPILAPVGANPGSCRDLPALSPKPPSGVTLTVTVTVNISTP